MTVSSLWTVLDESNCGRPVGIESFPLRDDHRGRRGTFAVDTSIWICEAIASTALSSFHSDPALYLIYQRTTKLLKGGFGLIMVLEGNRRVSNDEGQELRQRRSGSQFLAATQRCETLLRMLGVPVVYANAEGEALCALLNEKGIVDGIISNDSDCFLFGATTIYTKFTLENLENRTVMRYDADRLTAAVHGSSRSIALSRKDLVAFALLTGSDMTSGVANVGHKKAIAFMDACRSLTQQPDEGTCLDKLLAWGDEANKPTEIHIDVNDDGPSTIQTRCCSLCLHPGSKDAHAKNGCAECGTSAGEGCYVVTSMEKIVTSMKQKISKMQQWSPQAVVDAYFSPNGNSIPNALASVASTTYAVSPAAAQLFQSTLILKGNSKSSSQEYIRQTLPPLLARLDLFSTAPRNVYATTSNQKYKPVPIRVEKMLVRKSVPCYEVIWAIVIDTQQIEFSTHELQALINAIFPRLVESFHREERKKQRGLIEQERHKKFVGTNKPRHQSQQQREKQFNRNMKPGQGRKRERHFDVHHVRKPRMLPANNATMQSHDVAMLMDRMRPMKSDVDMGEDECDPCGVEDTNWIDSSGQNSTPIRLDSNQGTARGQDKDSTIESLAFGDCARGDSVCSIDDHPEERGTYGSTCEEEDRRGNTHDNNRSPSNMPSLSPNQERIFCNLGMCVIECTPIRRSNF